MTTPCLRFCCAQGTFQRGSERFVQCSSDPCFVVDAGPVGKPRQRQRAARSPRAGVTVLAPARFETPPFSLITLPERAAASTPCASAFQLQVQSCKAQAAFSLRKRSQRRQYWAAAMSQPFQTKNEDVVERNITSITFTDCNVQARRRCGRRRWAGGRCSRSSCWRGRRAATPWPPSTATARSRCRKCSSLSKCR